MGARGWTRFRIAVAGRVFNLLLAAGWLYLWPPRAGADAAAASSLVLCALAALLSAAAWIRPAGFGGMPEAFSFLADIAALTWAFWRSAGPALATPAALALPVALAGASLGLGESFLVAVAAAAAVAFVRVGWPNGASIEPELLFYGIVLCAVAPWTAWASQARWPEQARRLRAFFGHERRQQIAELFSHSLFQVREYLSSLLSVVEITERKSAEAHTKEKLHQLQALILECNGKVGRLLDSMRWATAESEKDLSKKMRLDELINDCLTRVLDAYRPSGIGVLINCEPGIDLNTELPALALILTSAIQNAIESLERRSSGKQLTLSVRHADSIAEILIADNGGGISSDEKSHAFEPMFTSKAAAGGMGLGLSTSRLLMERLGGTISISAADGQARVLISVPLRQQPAMLTSGKATWPRRRADIRENHGN